MSLELDKVIGLIARMGDQNWWRREHLEADRQALIFGNQVAMVIQIRKHGTPEFYSSIQRPVAVGDGAG